MGRIKQIARVGQSRAVSEERTGEDSLSMLTPLGLIFRNLCCGVHQRALLRQRRPSIVSDVEDTGETQPHQSSFWVFLVMSTISAL